MKKPNERTLTQLADAAFQQATQKVIERAQESGTPVIVWEEEGLTEVEPQIAKAARGKRNGHSAKK
jgi:hypothetical protein